MSYVNSGSRSLGAYFSQQGSPIYSGAGSYSGKERKMFRNAGPGPLMSYKEGSLGDCSSCSSGMGEYFAANGMGEYFAANGFSSDPISWEADITKREMVVAAGFSLLGAAAVYLLKKK